MAARDMEPIEKIKSDVGRLHNRIDDIEDEHSETKSSIVELRKSTEYIDIFIEKMDVAIDKLHDISGSMSQIVVQQGARLDNQEKLIDRIIDTLEVRRSETESKIATVHSNVMLEVQRVQPMVNTEIKAVHDVVTRLDEKINKVEKWMWSMTGAVGVVVFAVEFLSKFV